MNSSRDFTFSASSLARFRSAFARFRSSLALLRSSLASPSRCSACTAKTALTAAPIANTTSIAVSKEATVGFRRHQRNACSGAAGPTGANWPIFDESTQVLGEFGGTLIAHRRVAGDGFQHNRFQVAWNLWVDTSQLWGTRGQYLLDQFRSIFCHKRRGEREQLVQRQAEGVYVGPVVAVPVKSLRGHVSQRTHDVARRASDRSASVAFANPKSVTQTVPWKI